jgi:hypothetical protein
MEAQSAGAAAASAASVPAVVLESEKVVLACAILAERLEYCHSLGWFLFAQIFFTACAGHSTPAKIVGADDEFALLKKAE